MINNEVLKSLFLSILERQDKSEIQHDSIIKTMNNANKICLEFKEKLELCEKKYNILKEESEKKV